MKPEGVKIIDAAGVDSHLPVLRWAQGLGDGSVLEFGGGLHSTSVLAMWDELGYRTATIEENPAWRRWMAERWPDHRVYPEATEALLQQGWSTVLIDHGEGEWAWIDARAQALEMVRPYVGVALVHDWHIGPGHRGELVEAFKYHGWFAPDDGTMHTAIASDVYEVKDAPIPGGRIYTGWDDAPEEWPN